MWPGPEPDHHYYTWARCLHAQLGRFISRDPIGYTDCISLFEYAWDSPTKWTDPQGLQIIVDIINHNQLEPEPHPAPPAFEGDEAKVFELCQGMPKPPCPCSCTQQVCEGVMRRVIEAVRDTWVFPFLPDRCEAWALELSQERLPSLDVDNPCITRMRVDVFDITRLPGHGLARCHAVVKFTLCDNELFYADVRFWGGGDHFFFGGDIPWENVVLLP